MIRILATTISVLAFTSVNAAVANLEVSISGSYHCDINSCEYTFFSTPTVFVVSVDTSIFPISGTATGPWTSAYPWGNQSMSSFYGDGVASALVSGATPLDAALAAVNSQPEVLSTSSGYQGVRFWQDYTDPNYGPDQGDGSTTLRQGESSPRDTPESGVVHYYDRLWDIDAGFALSGPSDVVPMSSALALYAFATQPSGSLRLAAVDSVWTVVNGSLDSLISTESLEYFGTYRVAPVPLPAAAWLLLSGLTGLSFVGRRRKAA